MIFLEKDHHAVRQLNTNRFLRLERRQRWRLNLVPGFDLGGAEADKQQYKAE
jgi:hypothetical protein